MILAEFIPKCQIHCIGTLVKYLLEEGKRNPFRHNFLLLILPLQKENDKQKPFVTKHAFHDFQSQKYDCLCSSLFLKFIYCHSSLTLEAK